jgi:hypothetical protein
LEFFPDDGDQDMGGDGAPKSASFSEDTLRQNSTVVASVNCLELPADGHFAWDVPWQGLKPNLFQFVYGPTKVVP